LDISLPPSLSRQDQNLPRKRFIIRTDSNYDPESKVLTAMLELPGVKKVDVRVTLSTCHYNGVRQITVSGHTDPVFAAPSAGGPGGDLTVRERKFGEFIRTFAVPAGIKVRVSPSAPECVLF
jgi:HSP20 family molecular chaperone IbpA